MSESEKNEEAKGDEVLRRMLKTPPDPHGKPGESKTSLKQKPDGNPGKKRRPVSK